MTITAQDDRIPLVDLGAQHKAVESEIGSAVAGVISSSRFIGGPEVERFEAAFAAYCDCRFAVGVASGTAAIELTLRALDIGPGDEVITTPFTFFATAEAILQTGASVVFADVDPVTFNIDPGAVARVVTPRTRAIVPVHLYGRPAELAGLRAIADSHGLAIIEDAAQAHGARYHGQRAGSIGAAGCFSFFPSKNLGALGDAGAVVTNNETIAARVRSLRDHGRSSKYVHQEVGFGHRLDALQAAVLSAKLPYLDRNNTRRRRLAERYNDLLSGTDLVLPAADNGTESVYHLYVVRTPRRDSVIEGLKSAGVESGVHYPLPLHLQPALHDMGLGRGSFPVSEAAADTVLSLPLYPEMTEAQQDRVVAALRRLVG
ncbi:MAG: DegT/DnrJ/EryC1/StrS family aminotransferase [Caldilineales bacterium]